VRRARSPDVLVTGLRLPDGDGLALVKRARAAAPDVGIVVLTMAAPDVKLMDALGAGAVAVVGRDAPTEEVVAAARTVNLSILVPAPDLTDATRGPLQPPAGHDLTPRELEVLRLLADGLVISQIAPRLYINASTAKTYVANIYDKLGAATRAQAIMTAVRLGLIGDDRGDALLPAGPQHVGHEGRQFGGRRIGGGVFERFTDEGRRVVVLAQEEARMLNHDYMGTEHLLLGLVQGQGVGGEALESLGISLQAVREQVREIIGQGQQAPPRHIPFTHRAKKVLELSLREALQLGHDYIGTEHILLGLIREGEGVAAQVLIKLGADLHRVREATIGLLAAPRPQKADKAARLTRIPSWSLPGAQSWPGVTYTMAIAVTGLRSGLAELAPGAATGWHHHSDVVTSIYVLTGRVRLEFGVAGSDALECGLGDFVHVPAGAVYRALNPGYVTATTILSHAGPGSGTIEVAGPAE
jgi:DNA-binding NarL/FixJ family response regulator/uncharacterized RmlC-like cupin family protein